MAINFPTSLDTLTNPAAGDTLNSPAHATQHADANDAVEALEAKVGINSSAVTSSLDYKVTNAASANPGHTHTASSAPGRIIQVGSAYATSLQSSATGMADLNTMSVSLTVAASSRLVAYFTCSHSNSSTGNRTAFRFVVDGSNIDTNHGNVSKADTNGFAESFSMVYRSGALSSGARIVKVQWAGNTDGGTAYCATRSLVVMEESA